MIETPNNPQPPERSSAPSAFTIALVAASLVGLYTLWVAYQPEPSANSLINGLEHYLDYLILPGIIVGVIANATIYLASKWLMAGTNFALYFGVVYAVARFREKHKAKRLSSAQAVNLPKPL